MTKSQLDEIEARANKATPGPWWIKRREAGPMLCSGKDEWPQNWLCDLGITVSGDRIFIAHSRADVDALIAALRESESRAAELEKKLALAVDVAHWTQATLTALNVGNIESESLLHKKLREVMISYREALEALESDPQSTTNPERTA